MFLGALSTLASGLWELLKIIQNLQYLKENPVKDPIDNPQADSLATSQVLPTCRTGRTGGVRFVMSWVPKGPKTSKHHAIPGGVWQYGNGKGVLCSKTGAQCCLHESHSTKECLQPATGENLSV